jgi:peroxiredoxin
VAQGGALTQTARISPLPRRQVSLRGLFAGKRGILFAVPGAFTPGCSKARARRAAAMNAPAAVRRKPCADAIRPRLPRASAPPQSHLPSFVRDAAKLREMGVDVVACVATNDQYAPRSRARNHSPSSRARIRPPAFPSADAPAHPASALATRSWVMQAWGESAGAAGKVRMLSDADGALTKALGQEKPSGVLTRSQRYSAIVVDNKIAAWNAEAAGGFECTLADALIAALPAVLKAAPVDPMEAFCESDPSADECRVYSD